MKEYEILNSGVFSEDIGVAYILETALRQSTFSILDVDRLRAKMNSLIDFIELKKRFFIINEKIGGKADVTSQGFTLEGHKFETLDELEKAINLKAFL